MFSGIIKNVGLVVDTHYEGSNKIFWISSGIASDLHIDQSISHNGVCLTVEEIKDDLYKVTAINETLEKTNLDLLKAGDPVNLETSITLQTLLDGHIVQGHVDTTVICVAIMPLDGSHVFSFKFDHSFADLIIEKGSITLNGVSLTVFDIADNQFSVAIIPYTFAHTNFNAICANDKINVEFDVIGKYINRALAVKHLTK